MSNNGCLYKINRTTSIILDVFRIISALMVFWGHAFSMFGVTLFKDDASFLNIQSLAVINFFVLSGFLMMYSIEYRYKESYMEYVFHQGKRIFIIYVPCVLFFWLCDNVYNLMRVGSDQLINNLNFGTLISNLFMMQGIIAPVLGSNRPLWTMTYEWWSYVVVAFVFICGRRLFLKDVRYGIKLLTCCLIIISVSAYTYFLWEGIPLIFDFVMGVFIYAVIRFFTDRYGDRSYFIYLQIIGAIIAISAVIVIVLSGLKYRNAYVLPIFLAVPVFFAGLVMIGTNNKDDVTVEKESGNGMDVKALRFISKSTYPLYLIHYPLISYTIWINKERIDNKMGLASMLFIIAILLSMAVTVLADKIAPHKDEKATK